MPTGRLQRDGYDSIELEHHDVERPLIRQALSSDTAHGQVEEYDVKSFQSNSPLDTTSTYPPLPSQAIAPKPSKHVRMPDDVMHPHPGYDAERAGRYEGMPHENHSQSRPPHDHRSSWDILGGIKKFEHNYEEFDSSNASEAHLAFADGDVPKDKFSRLYNYLLNVSIVTRWILFIVPVLAILWIPGILSFTKFPNAEVWSVGLLWWSTWLSVAWVGWWTSLALAWIAPHVFRKTLGIVAIGTRRYIDWFAALARYVALFGWCIAMWISFAPLISHNQNKAVGGNSPKIISLIQKLLFAFCLCAGLLLFEKFAIQWIAAKFHELSYAGRIAEQKFAVKVLVTLYRHSSDIPGRSDTLSAAHTSHIQSRDTKRFFKRAMKGVRVAATTTTTAFGNVASEIAGTSVLQPNSPSAMIKTALESANKSRLLARRLFYSFVKHGGTHIYVEDIAKYFSSREAADAAYAIFDRDSNGDVTRDEMEAACMDFHQEQLSIEHSMSDMDSAVGRLDNLFISLYVVVAALIIAVALEAQLATLITGAGTLLLGLSWLIGATLQEVLASIIFLFIKHPFDVGDRISILKDTYTVKEIRLVSTVFVDAQGCIVQAPNVVLNTTYIQNMRRSEQMSETFPFEVDYTTTFEQLEELRNKMLVFLKAERRDYLPSFDVVVVDFPDQQSLSLTADIKYKSNWQQGALKAKRRNKWICALKTSLAEVKIFGPKGNPKAIPPPERRTLVPWDEVKAKDEAALQEEPTEPKMPIGGWQLLDRNAVIMDSGDVFGESDELHMTNPRRGLSDTGLRQVSTAGTSTPPSTTRIPASAAMAAAAVETIEMTSRSGPGA